LPLSIPNLREALARLRDETSPFKGLPEVYVTDVVRCLRLSYLERTGAVPPDPDVLSRVRLIQALGNILHEVVGRVFPEGWLSEVSVRVCNGRVCLGGRVDLYNPSENVLVEVKTRAYVPDRPVPHHVVQARLYASVLGARRVHLLYIGRARGDYRVFDVKPYGRPHELLRWAFERGEELARALAEGRPPGVEYGPWCSGCSFSRHCPLRGKKTIDFREVPDWVSRFGT